jgi:hypothetical protein
VFVCQFYTMYRMALRNMKGRTISMTEIHNILVKRTIDIKL